MTTRTARPPCWLALAGGGAGVVVTVLVAARVWPDDHVDGRGAEGVVDIPAAALADPRRTSAERTSASPEPPTSDDRGRRGARTTTRTASRRTRPAIADAAPAGTGPPAGRLAGRPARRRPSTVVRRRRAAARRWPRPQPGDSIELADGSYAGNFATTASGTADAPDLPVRLVRRGARRRRHREAATPSTSTAPSYWRLVGFTVTGGQKGVMADGTRGLGHPGPDRDRDRRRGDPPAVLQHRQRRARQHDQRHRPPARQVRRGRLHRHRRSATGAPTPTARPTAATATSSKGNTISDTTSESIDIKEGTTGGVDRWTTPSTAPGMTGPTPGST